ncbi:MAG: RNA polymerase sigma factor [Candidatus Thorarchaeota archaeon]|jgi:RNA polymerase sigma factor (sigma-70 family)
MDIDAVSKLACLGDDMAERELFRWLRERLLLIAGHKIRAQDDAEDVVQSTMLVISKKYRTVRFKRSLVDWAYGVFKYEVRKYYERKSKERSRESSLGTAFDVADNQATDPELRRKILSCLSMLHKINPRYALVVHYKSLGYGSDEICSKMAITRGNLYTITNRARKLLKSCLNGEDNQL